MPETSMEKKTAQRRRAFGARLSALGRDVVENRAFYLLALPGIIYFVIFKYLPMYGLVVAFKDFSPRLGILGSHWVGLKHFTRLFASIDFASILRNTLLINVYRIFFTTPLVIVFALMLNEIRNGPLKRIVQTISYFPHFLSWVVVAGVVSQLFAPQSGSINRMIIALGGKPLTFLVEPRAFRGLIVVSGLWKELGWSSIIYLAAITGINPELYEAAGIDGARKLRQAWHITIPCIMPTVVTLLLINIGNIMSVGFEHVYVFLNPVLYEVGDVFATYIIRVGLGQGRFSYTAAVGFFNSLVGFLLLVVANRLSRKLADESLW